LEERGTLAFGKSGLADIAVKEAMLLVLFAVAVADREVAPVTEAVFGAVGILTTEAG
jgi:hypothetical protein